MGISVENLLAGIGGPANICDVEVCLTRLRIEVEDSALIDEDQLRADGVLGIVMQNDVIHVVTGPGADDIDARIRAACRGENE